MASGLRRQTGSRRKWTALALSLGPFFFTWRALPARRQLGGNEEGCQRDDQHDKADRFAIPLRCERSRKSCVALVLRGAACSCLYRLGIAVTGLQRRATRFGRQNETRIMPSC